MKILHRYQSPIGPLTIISDDNRLTGLRPTKTGDKFGPPNSFSQNTKKQLDNYFNHKLTKFNLPVKLTGTTFQKKVTRAILKIPFGQTVSYQDIAITIGNKLACRAVGQALNHNQIMIVVPCHRVISSDGKIQGFAWSVKTKKWLLKHEATSSKLD